MHISDKIKLAIKAINPDAEYSMFARNLDTIEWHNNTPPIPKADIEAKMNEMANEPEQSNYAQQRRNAYPQIGDQLDMLWHTIDKDITLQHKYFDFYQAILKVKAKYPKK